MVKGPKRHALILASVQFANRKRQCQISVSWNRAGPGRSPFDLGHTGTERVSAVYVRPQTATSSQPRLLCESLSQCVDGTLEHTSDRTTRPFVSFFIAKSRTDPVPHADFTIDIRCGDCLLLRGFATCRKNRSGDDRAAVTGKSCCFGAFAGVLAINTFEENLP